MARSVFFALVMVSLVAPVLAGDATTAPASLSDNPGVVDAIAAWETWIEYQLAIERVPAASVGSVHDQELLSARGFGLANPDTGSPATADTIDSICSISKLFTSVALMQLSDEGRVRIDQPVADYLDWFSLHDAQPNDEPIGEEFVFDVDESGAVTRFMSHSNWMTKVR